MDKELILSLNELFSLEIKEDAYQKLKARLAEKINELIIHDFNKLIQILYRMDVNETKLKILLKENSTQNASEIIASLVIERQLQKLKSRRDTKYKSDFDEEENGKDNLSVIIN